MQASPDDRRRHRWLQRTLLSLGALIVLSGAALIGALLLKAPLLRVLASHTNHPIRIDGAFDVRLISHHPYITATNVAIANPPWSPPGVMAQLGRVQLTLRWRASTHPLQIERLEIDGAIFHLYRDRSARANWHTHAQGPGEGPPLIESLSMRDARVELTDERRHLQFSGTVSVTDAATDGAPAPLRIAGAGQLNGRPASLQIDAEPLASARRGQPYHFRLAEHSGGAQLSATGYLERAFDFRALQANFEATGPGMQELYFLVGLKLPTTGPFQLSGQLTRRGKRFLYRELAARSGSSDLGGTLTVDSSGARTHLEGQLRSRLLALADLGARAAHPDRTPATRTTAPLPDTPLSLGALQRIDASVGYQAAAVKVGPDLLQSLAAHVSIDHGMLTISPLEATLAQGRIAGQARLDATADAPHAQLSLTATALQLAQLIHGKNAEPLLSGPLSAHLQLSAQGHSLKDWAAGTRGTLTAVLPHGAMRASIAELISLDVTGALGLLFTHRKDTPIRCGVADLVAEDGVLRVQSFVLDTDRSLIIGSGNAGLASETLAFALRGQLEHPGLALRAAIAIEGPLRHPEIRLTERGGLMRGTAAVARAIVPAALLPRLNSLDPDFSHSTDCAALMAPPPATDARSAAATSTRTPAAR